MRPTTRTATSVIAALLTAATITACGDSNSNDADASAPATPSTGTVFSTDTNTSGTDQNPVDQAKEQALQKFRDFVSVITGVEKDPTVPLEQLQTVAGDPVLADWNSNVTLRRSQGIRTTGDATILRASVTDTGIPVDDEGEAKNEPAWIHIEACVDMSGYNWVNPDGSSGNAPGKLDYRLEKVTVRNPTWPDPNGWRVTSQAEAVSCTP